MHPRGGDHGGGWPRRRQRRGGVRGTGAAAGNPADPFSAARSERARTRSRASASRAGCRSGVWPAFASRRRDRQRPGRLAGVPDRRQAASDPRGRRRPVHSRRNDPRGEERRPRHRGGARHLHRREGKAARRHGGTRRGRGERKRDSPIPRQRARGRARRPEAPSRRDPLARQGDGRPIDRRARLLRCSRNWSATGAPATTGGRPRRS